MARPTEDLVRRTLQDIQETHAEHGRKLSGLQSGRNGIRESVGTVLGLSAHATARNDRMEDCLRALKPRMRCVEARVPRLEMEEA